MNRRIPDLIRRPDARNFRSNSQSEASNPIIPPTALLDYQNNPILDYQNNFILGY